MTQSPPGNYPPPPPGNNPPPPGNFPPPPPGNNPPPPGSYPPPPPGNYPPPPPPGYEPVGNRVGQLPPEAYTSWIARVGAYFIDIIPIVVLYVIALVIIVASADKDCSSNPYGYGGSCTVTPSGIGSLLTSLVWLAIFGYGLWNFGYRQGVTGSSIGKSVLKFKVVSELTGQPIGFGLSVVRQLAHFVDGMIFGIGYLFPLWDLKRQTLADKIMTTVCLPTNRPD